MKLFLFIIILCFCGFTQDPDKCIIIPLKGINDIVIDKSSFEDVKKEFGKKKIKKKWSRTELEIFGHFDYSIKYDQIGTFSSISIPGRSKHVVNFVEIDSTCKCKTKKGLGIGSSYQDVIKELGKPKYFWFMNGNTELNYEENKLNMAIMLNGRDTTTNKVYEICWYASHRH